MEWGKTQDILETMKTLSMTAFNNSLCKTYLTHNVSTSQIHTPLRLFQCVHIPHYAPEVQEMHLKSMCPDLSAFLYNNRCALKSLHVFPSSITHLSETYIDSC
jgi:hypothetical protein